MTPNAETANAPEATVPKASGRAGNRRGSAATGKVVFDLWGQRGWAGHDVVGESNYLDHVRRVIGRAHQAEGAEHLHSALLVAEPANPHDRHAVAVQIAGQTVGYLPREDAPAYSRVFQRLAAQGFVAQVQARIWAGDYDDYEVDRRGNYVQSTRFGAGVRVDLGEPHLLVPGNMPPPGAHELLPVGGAIQVTGEEAHTDVLAAHCGAAGEQWAYATLHEVTQQLARSTRTVVEVRLDDQRIGQLTPKMSGDLVAAIRHINELGGAAACRALVKGNRAAAQVTLYVQRSHELEDVWFDDVRRRHRG
jgi:collagen type III alpha